MLEERCHVAIVLRLDPLEQRLDLGTCEIQQRRCPQDTIVGQLWIVDPTKGDSAKERDLHVTTSAGDEDGSSVGAFVEHDRAGDERHSRLELAVIEMSVREEVEVNRRSMRETKRKRRTAVEHVTARNSSQRALRCG